MIFISILVSLVAIAVAAHWLLDEFDMHTGHMYVSTIHSTHIRIFRRTIEYYLLNMIGVFSVYTENLFCFSSPILDRRLNAIPFFYVFNILVKCQPSK